jgi:hypothetical protein
LIAELVVARPDDHPVELGRSGWLQAALREGIDADAGYGLEPFL